MPTPEGILIAVVGVLVGIVGTVFSMLYKALTDRLKVVEDKQSAADKSHNDVVTDIAESKAERNAFKEVIAELKDTVKQLLEAVNDLKVTVGK